MDNQQHKKNKIDKPYAIKSNLATYKEIDESNRIIKAITNTYNFYDHDCDVLRMGCAKKSITDRGSKSKSHDKVLHALFHDLTRLPGKSVHEAETVIDGKQVLYAESKLAETNEGEDTLINYKDGIYNQHSIGFQYVQLEYLEKEGQGWDKYISSLLNPELADEKGYGFDVTEINWFEWSTVSFAANKLTPYLGTKTLNKAIQIQNVYTKMDALLKKAKKMDVKNKSVFKLQYNQLKQMISELAMQKPSRKGTHSIEPSNNDTSIDYASLISRI